jgi:exopolyphosphatase/guanosine-5'-triphosphate,3'-diphosphate pyrophosphatase
LLISKLAAILSLAKSIDVEYNQKIDEIKTSIRNGILTITAYTDSDISLEEREFNIAQEFFEEVFGIKAVLVKKGLK